MKWRRLNWLLLAARQLLDTTLANHAVPNSAQLSCLELWGGSSEPWWGMSFKPPPSATESQVELEPGSSTLFSFIFQGKGNLGGKKEHINFTKFYNQLFLSFNFVLPSNDNDVHPTKSEIRPNLKLYGHHQRP